METAFKVIEPAGHVVKDSTTCVVNKLCKRKTSKYAVQTTTPATNPLTSTTASLTTSSASSHPPQEGSDNPRSTPEQPRVLRLVLASFSLHSHTNKGFVSKRLHSVLSLARCIIMVIIFWNFTMF